MTDRERLIELIEQAERKEKYDFLTADLDEAIDMSGGTKISCSMEYLVDYLLENGVIVPPCKVGDKVYELTTSEEIEQRKVKDIIYDNEGFRLRLEPYFSYEYYLNETVFLTREEAEKALKERKNEVMRYMPKRN